MLIDYVNDSNFSNCQKQFQLLNWLTISLCRQFLNNKTHSQLLTFNFLERTQIHGPIYLLYLSGKAHIKKKQNNAIQQIFDFKVRTV